MRRLVLTAAFVLVGTSAAVLSGCGSGESSNLSPSPSASIDGGATGRPAASDLVLITLDTLRADVLGFSNPPGRAPGRPLAETPALDRLATAGRVFDFAHAHNVVTLPSHVNILTGLYPPQHGVRENSGFILSPEIPTLATHLRSAGFATAAFVGAFPLDSRFGLTQGFDVYDDDYPSGSDPERFQFAERRGDAVVAKALDWWTANAGAKRFVWIHLYDPHAPYAPPEPFATRYAARPYLGEVAATDAFLAPFLEKLDPARALLVVTSDHGEALGDHGERTHGLFAYEATLKIPLLVWGRGVEPGREARPVGHVDIAPTLLEAAGLDVPDELPGRSLRGDLPEERAFYFEALSTYFNRGWAPLRGLVGGRDKVLELPLPELYDLTADPAEASNLFNAERDRFRGLYRRLGEVTVAVDDPWPPEQREISADEAAELRSLGYLSSSAARSGAFTAADDPKNLIPLDNALHDLIDAYSRGDLPTAARLAQGVVEARPTMALGYEHLALILRQMERPGEAIAVMNSAVERGVADASLLRQLGLTLAENGLARRAVEILEPLAGDGDPEALVALAVALSDAGRLADAVRTFERVLAGDPEDVKALEGLGVALLRGGRTGDARRALERALELNPRLPRSWNTLGVLHAQSGDPAAAMAAWKKALEINPNLLDTLYNLGLVAAQAGDRETARGALQRYIDTAPPQRFADDIARARQVLEGL